MRRLVLLALPLALAACSEADETVTADPATSSPVPAAGTRLIVGANGFDNRMGAKVRFGVPRAEADAAAEAALGPATERTAIAECGPGPLEFSRYGPLQLAFLDGRFAGWYLRPGDGVETSDGIRPGIAVEALRQERAVRDLDTTIEGEFEYTAADYGTITGFSSGEGAARRIEALQAGVGCVFR